MQLLFTVKQNFAKWIKAQSISDIEPNISPGANNIYGYSGLKSAAAFIKYYGLLYNFDFGLR